MNNLNLLLSVKTLTELSEIPANVDPHIIRPIIREVQDMRIEPVIGSKLFEALKLKVKEDDIDGVYKILLEEYITPVMVYGVLAELPLRMNYRAQNQGFISKTSENSQNNSDSDLYKISKKHESTREFYSNKLSSYLCDKASLFPEYKTETLHEEKKPRNTSFDTGLFLG
jgi:hypothetical protein